MLISARFQQETSKETEREQQGDSKGIVDNSFSRKTKAPCVHTGHDNVGNPLNMNLLRRFGAAHGHPIATDSHPLTGIGRPIHQRLYGHGAVHQADAGVGGVAVYAGVGQGCV